MRAQAAIFLGGCLGALARAGFAQALPPSAAAWPWATLLVNVAGAALLGWAATRPWSHERRLFVGTGFCGALTTFSTLQLELVQMLDAGRWLLALAYVATSLAAGFGGLLLASNLALREQPAR